MKRMVRKYSWHSFACLLSMISDFGRIALRNISRDIPTSRSLVLHQMGWKRFRKRKNYNLIWFFWTSAFRR